MFEFFGKSNENKGDNGALRIDFDNKEQWATLLEASYQEPVYLFKHSSRCGISSMVLKRFEKQLKERGETYYYLHIQGFRSLSNWLAEELNVRHESPQLIILKNGEVLKHDSHYELLNLLSEH